MKYYLLGIILVTLIGCSGQKDHTTQASATKKAQICASCHDPNVKTNAIEAPSLLGRPYNELVTAIEEVHEYHVSQPSLMHDFKTEDIHGIATYFSDANNK